MASTAEIISIGDELLYGQVFNTNAAWIAVKLDRIGIKVVRMTTVGDVVDDILTAFAEAEARADITLITGGLGPTDDDLTKSCLSTYFNSPLMLNEQALQDVSEIFRHIGKELNEVNRSQAMLPECCEKITNKKGTAPGMLFKKGSKVLISMPGVPGEMKYMMMETILPRLTAEFNTAAIVHKVVRTIGVGESWLAEKISPWAGALPTNIKLAYLPELGHVKLRLTASGDDREKLERELEAQIQNLKPYIEKNIYGYDDELLEAALGKLLIRQKKTIALAESCTGGYISHLLTSIPGSSAYFRGTFIPYHNDLKLNLLSVNPDTLLAHGAVSEETVKEMAVEVRRKAQADIGLAISGIAGPSGGTPEKPVGTVWIACADGKDVNTKKLQLFKDRKMNIESSGVAALNLVRLTLLQSVELNS